MTYHIIIYHQYSNLILDIYIFWEWSLTSDDLTVEQLCPDLRAPWLPCLERHGMEGQLQELAHQAGRTEPEKLKQLGMFSRGRVP